IAIISAINDLARNQFRCVMHTDESLQSFFEYFLIFWSQFVVASPSANEVFLSRHMINLHI
ncbi:hypothetical protein C3L29_038185, partial [Pseudomonas sp. MWU12-2534b]